MYSNSFLNLKQKSQAIRLAFIESFTRWQLSYFCSHHPHSLGFCIIGLEILACLFANDYIVSPVGRVVNQIKPNILNLN
jgi:hypothetical protein